MLRLHAENIKAKKGHKDDNLLTNETIYFLFIILSGHNIFVSDSHFLTLQYKPLKTYRIWLFNSLPQTMTH